MNYYHPHFAKETEVQRISNLTKLHGVETQSPRARSETTFHQLMGCVSASWLLAFENTDLYKWFIYFTFEVN